MKARTIRHVTAALAMLTCLAGYAMTGSKVEAQNSVNEAILEAIKGVLQEQCKNAWNASPASETCVFEQGSIEWKDGNCHLTGVYCHRSQGAYDHNTWQGSITDTDDLVNCQGTLRRGTC